MDEIELLLSLFQQTLSFDGGGLLEDLINPVFENDCEIAQFTESVKRGEANHNNLFASLQIQKEEIESRKSEILSREFIKPIIANYPIEKKFNPASKQVCKEADEHLVLMEDFAKPLDSIYAKLIECLYCINHYENFYNSRENIRLRQKFFSALGQIRSLLTRLYSVFATWGVSKTSTEMPVSFLELLKNLKKLHEAKKSVVNYSFVRLENKIDNCIALLGELGKEINVLTEKCEHYNDKIREPLAEINLLLSKQPYNKFFLPKPKIKYFEKIFIRQADEFSLTQRFTCLQSLIKVINYEASQELLKLYEVMAQRDQYENILNCVKQQLKNLKKIKFQTISSNLAKLSNQEKNIACFHGAIKQGKQSNFSLEEGGREETKTVPENFLENEAKQILLKEFEQWDAEFSIWKTKSEVSLFNIFQTIEEASVTVLNITSPTFLEILHYSREEFSVKEKGLKEQQLKLAHCYTALENPFITYLFQYEQWFTNLFARMDTCTQLLYEYGKKYQLINSDDSINKLQLQFFSRNRPAEFDSLLTAYLASIVRCNKTKAELTMEEGKLYYLNREFISKVQCAGSLNFFEQEATLFSRFNEQITKINQLKGFINQEYADRQKIKVRLAEIIPPNLLQFYIDRIDPSDRVALMNYQLTWPVTEAVYSPPTAFYCMPLVGEATNLSNLEQLVYPTFNY